MVSVVGAVSEKPLRTSTPRARAFCEGEGRDMSGGGSAQWRITDYTDGTDRWHVVCLLLAAPAAESRRLCERVRPG